MKIWWNTLYLSLDRHDRIKNVHDVFEKYVHLVETNGLTPADFHFKEMFLNNPVSE